MNDNEITELRLAVRANGWRIKPTNGGQRSAGIWFSTPQDERAIADWVHMRWPDPRHLLSETGRKRGLRLQPYAGTSVQISDNICVLHLDINDQETVDAIAKAIFDQFPHLNCPTLLVRCDEGTGEAWFLRTDKPVKSRSGGSWLPPGSNPLDDSIERHAVAIVGGGDKRTHEFSAFGPCRTVPPYGEEVAVASYRWDGGISPANVRPDALPLLTGDQPIDVLEAALTVLQQRGWSLP